MSDPVFELVTRYQNIEADYNACDKRDLKRLAELQDAHTDAIVELTDQEHRATSLEGALKAIRQALAEEKEANCGERYLTTALLEMGLAFFESDTGDGGVS